MFAQAAASTASSSQVIPFPLQGREPLLATVQQKGPLESSAMDQGPFDPIRPGEFELQHQVGTITGSTFWSPLSFQTVNPEPVQWELLAEESFHSPSLFVDSVKQRRPRRKWERDLARLPDDAFSHEKQMTALYQSFATYTDAPLVVFAEPEPGLFNEMVSEIKELYTDEWAAFALSMAVVMGAGALGVTHPLILAFLGVSAEKMAFPMTSLMHAWSHRHESLDLDEHASMSFLYRHNQKFKDWYDQAPNSMSKRIAIRAWCRMWHQLHADVYHDLHYIWMSALSFMVLPVGLGNFLALNAAVPPAVLTRKAVNTAGGALWKGAAQLFAKSEPAELVSESLAENLWTVVPQTPVFIPMEFPLASNTVEL